MKQDLAGKRLLILGGRPAASLDIVRIAKRLGIYTVVTDNLSVEKSPAKAIADEVWNISTSNVDVLEQMVTEHRIDGIITGAHEFNLQRAKELCDRLGFPFYATDLQLRLNFDKVFFKQKCQEYSIPVPQSYELSYPPQEEDMKKIAYPVIVKPLDGSGGQGISICQDAQELCIASKLAHDNSPSGQIIVEEYVTGREITAVYTLKSGQISLSTFRDRYPTEEHDRTTAQYDLSLMPSRHTRRFYDTEHPKFVNMLQSVDARDGCIFFQGIVTVDRIVFFECGYRINALCDYHNICQLNQINYLEMMINHSLTGKMEPYELEQDNVFPSTVSAIFNMTAHGGVIGRQVGAEAVRQMKNVIAADYLHTEGDTIVENGSLGQSVFRAHVFGDNLQELADVIRQIQQQVIIEDTNGANMLYHPFDTDRLFCKGDNVL